MNQDQVKDKLRTIQPNTEEFTLIFSGKSSKKVNGLYKPDTKEIIIHNKNFTDDNQLLYTAIHEFAHHVHTTTSVRPVSCRSHTIEFRNIFHRLLERAEQKQVYVSIFDANEEFAELTARIKETFFAGGGALMKEFGKALVEARELCEKHHARFEDYIERMLCMSQTSAVTYIKMHAYDVNPALGTENMKTISAIKDEITRKEAEAAMLAGASPDTVKAKLREKQEPESRVDALLKERQRLEKTIRGLQDRLAELEEKIRVMEGVA